MVTTNSVLPIEAFGNDPLEPIRLTGCFHMVARVTMGSTGDLPAHVELCFDAARVRGVGLKSGTRYAARGAYRLIDDLPEPLFPVHLVIAFELLRHGPGDPPSTRLLLVVPFQVTIRNDGKVRVGIHPPTLLPCPGG